MHLDVENEIERSLLQTEFERSNIASQFFMLESNVLGKSSAVEGRIGFFEISESDFPLAREIYDNLRESRTEDTISAHKTIQIFTVPRVLVAALIVVLCGAVSFLIYDNARLEKLTHYAENLSEYTRKWNFDKTQLSRYYKETGILAAEFFDRNLNGHWEEEDFYDKKGILRSRDFSSKDDGVFDNYLYYDHGGKLVQKSHISAITSRDDVLDVTIDENSYYEFTATPDQTSYYSVKKVIGQVN